MQPRKETEIAAGISAAWAIAMSEDSNDSAPKPKGKPGRKTKLTPERQRRIVDAIRAGCYVETAAATSGVTKETLYQWLKRGNKYPGTIYEEFVHAVHDATAQAEMRDVLTISKAASEGDWRAAAWRLERKFPKRWGTVNRTEISGVDGKPIQTVDVTKLSDEQLAAIVSASRHAPDGEGGT